jgi:LysR family transcriptional regulator, glycine cleavage system transcriptional activator
MHASLPPLNALRAFEAAARHLSLTKAALELHVTPGALSHQIRGLEEHLGVALFLRGARAIALTEAGRLLHPGLQTAFGLIRQSVETVTAPRKSNTLVISTPPGFTAKWLAPRLWRFLNENPGLDARVSSSPAYVDLKVDDVDVAIRNLPIDAPRDPSLLVEKLADLVATPVCSPAYAARIGGLRSPADLRDAALIFDDSLSGSESDFGWVGWLKSAGVDGVDLGRGLRFSSADHALEATVEGAGVQLAYTLLTHDDRRSGRLVAPFGLTLPSRRAMYVACLKGREKRPNIAAFRDWIKAEIAAMSKVTA